MDKVTGLGIGRVQRRRRCGYDVRQRIHYEPAPGMTCNAEMAVADMRS
jgi:hypothetical protein